MVLSVSTIVTFQMLTSQNPSTIAANIALQFAEASGTALNALIASGLVLFVITLVINMLARYIVRRRSQLRGRNRCPSRSVNRHRRQRLRQRQAARVRPVAAARRQLGRLRAWSSPCSTPVAPSRTSTSSRAIFLGTVLFDVLIVVISRIVEGGRKAMDRLVTSLVVTAFIIAVLPLVSLLWTVVAKGLARFDANSSRTRCAASSATGGGALHALIGTLEITLFAALISVPIGLLTSIYLVEYGRGDTGAAASPSSSTS